MRITTSPDQAPRRADGRRGVVMTVELVFLAPVILIIMLATVEFYMMIAARMNMLNASRAGARVAVSNTYADKARAKDEVTRTVKETLGTGRLSRFSSVHVTWSQDVPANKTAGQSDWVLVEVDAPARQIIPDVLGYIGFSISRDTLVGGTKMKQE